MLSVRDLCVAKGVDPAAVEELFISHVAPGPRAPKPTAHLRAGRAMVSVGATAVEIDGFPRAQTVTVEGRGEFEVRLGAMFRLERLDVGQASLTVTRELPALTSAVIRGPVVVGMQHCPALRTLVCEGWRDAFEDLDLHDLSGRLEPAQIRVRHPENLVLLRLSGVKNLRGIERFSNLAWLRIPSATVTDLRALSALSELEVLDVRNVRAPLEPLWALPKLRIIAAYGCPQIPKGLAGRCVMSRRPSLEVLARAPDANDTDGLWTRIGPMLLSSDLDAIDVACDALSLSGSPELLAWLLNGVSVWNLHSPNLHRAPAQRGPHVHALLRLIAQAPEGTLGAHVREDLASLELRFDPPAVFDLSTLAGLPRLRFVRISGLSAVRTPARPLSIAHLELSFIPGAAVPPELSAWARLT